MRLEVLVFFPFFLRRRGKNKTFFAPQRACKKSVFYQGSRRMLQKNINFFATFCSSSSHKNRREKTKFDSTVDEGKGQLNPSRDENEGKHRRRGWGIKVYKRKKKKAPVFAPSCVTRPVGSDGWTETYAAKCGPLTLQAKYTSRLDQRDCHQKK